MRFPCAVSPATDSLEVDVVEKSGSVALDIRRKHETTPIILERDGVVALVYYLMGWLRSEGSV